MEHQKPEPSQLRAVTSSDVSEWIAITECKKEIESLKNRVANLEKALGIAIVGIGGTLLLYLAYWFFESLK